MFREQGLIVDMYIEGNPLTHFLSFSLIQEFNSHHHFELRLEHGRLGLPGLINLNESRDYIGRTFSVSFGYDQTTLQNFSGLITNVALSQSNGYQGELVITGHSPTILLDRGADLGSYLDRDLSSIVKLASNELASNDLYFAINPSRKAPLDYVIQYRESDFEFLNRLSAEYYEWFYYDGECLHFGKPDELEHAKLTYGQEISALDYGINIAPIKQKHFFYDAKSDEMMASESEGRVKGSVDLLHAADRSNLMYSKVFNQQAIPRIDSFGDLRDLVQYEEQAKVGQLLKVNATSDSPKVKLGLEVEIETSVRQELSFVSDTLGKFLITKVEHHLDGLEHYSNRFEGIVGGTERLPVKNYRKPNADLQLANVVANDDPDGQGRVKVRFKWQCHTNEETTWLRVSTPDAGGSGQVKTNRGLVSIPEIGDQVIVAFEEGNIARPIVMGSVFQGKTGTGGGNGNHIKSLSSKSGNMVKLDDRDGSVYITDKGAANMHFDGAGNSTTNANNTHAVNAGSANVINVGAKKDTPPQSLLKMDADGNIVLDGKKKITFCVGENKIEISKEGIVITASEGKIEGTALTGPVAIESKVAGVDIKASTAFNLKGADVAVNGDATIRFGSPDTDIT